MRPLETFDVFHILGNKNRCLIVRELSKRGGKATYSDLSHKLRMNPKSARDHLKVLLDAGIVIKTNPGYKLTKFGMELSDLFEETWVNIQMLLIQKRMRKEDD